MSATEVEMARKILVMGADGTRPMLTEVTAANELQLQTLLRDTPDLLPADELGVTGPLLVVGRETSLPSGAVDLVALGRSGDILIVELKTGPQNPDFRAALAQAIDYGADLWGMSVDVFESSVLLRYLRGVHCTDPKLKAARTLNAAAQLTWPDISEEDLEQFNERVQKQLEAGNFLFVVAAQRFTEPMLRTIEYLNNRLNGARFAAVELVAFAADGLQAFESRAAARPPSRNRTTGGPSLDESSFLELFKDPTYRMALEDLFDFCRGQRLRFEWGKLGPSIRAPIPGVSEPLTIGWLSPPDTKNSWGLTDLTLGYDATSLARRPNATAAARAYEEALDAINGAQPLVKKTLWVRTFRPEAVIGQLQAIKDALAGFVTTINEGGTVVAATLPSQ